VRLRKCKSGQPDFKYSEIIEAPGGDEVRLIRGQPLAEQAVASACDVSWNANREIGVPGLQIRPRIFKWSENSLALTSCAGSPPTAFQLSLPCATLIPIKAPFKLGKIGCDPPNRHFSSPAFLFCPVQWKEEKNQRQRGKVVV
jgi:hypothetical protein